MEIQENARKDALKKAEKLKNPVLIALASGQTNIKEKFVSDERTSALRRALTLEPVFIELTLQVADETAIKKMAGQLIIHKIKLAESSAVEELLKMKSFTKVRYNDFINEALRRKNKQILNVLFRNGASPDDALKNAFERADLEDLLLLLEVFHLL